MAKAKKKKAPPAEAVLGDCVKGMLDLPKRSVQLIVSDPPYNQGQPYDAYADNLSYDAYMDKTADFLLATTKVLTRHGSLWIFAPDEWVSEIDLLARRKFKYYKASHVVWAFTFGQAAQKKFTRSHCHLLWLTRSRTPTFNEDAVRVPSARQLVYKDPRANPGGKLPDATWMLLKEQLEPYMTPDRDTWLQSRVCGTFKERSKVSPNQIPVPVMERIVRSTSNPGDLVLDPFAGTGGLAEACVRHGRGYLGFDVSKACVEATNRRIADAQQQVA